jgi:hypothetical protein
MKGTIMNKMNFLNLASASSLLRSTDDDLLGGLGLDDGAETTPTAPVEDAAQPTDAAKTTREEVKIGELEAVSFDSIPPQRRNGGGASGSKYKFETIAAPVSKEEGGYKYDGKLVRLIEGEDADKLKRSVQSATTQANAQAKEANEVNRYITRQYVDKGEFAGVYIIRVDGTQDAEETPAAE